VGQGTEAGGGALRCSKSSGTRLDQDMAVIFVGTRSAFFEAPAWPEPRFRGTYLRQDT
jgi:hypothetical protein